MRLRCANVRRAVPRLLSHGGFRASALILGGHGWPAHACELRGMDAQMLCDPAIRYDDHGRGDLMAGGALPRGVGRRERRLNRTPSADTTSLNLPEISTQASAGISAGLERLPVARAHGNRSSSLFSRASSTDPRIPSGRDLF